MTNSPETVMEQAPKERGFLLENAELEAVASEVYDFTRRFQALHSDVLVNNPSFLGVAHKDIDGTKRAFFADFRQTAADADENLYEWMVSDGSPKKRIIYIVTDGFSINGALETKKPDGAGFQKRLLNVDELEAAPVIILDALEGVDFSRQVENHRDRKTKLTESLSSVMANPKLFKKYKDLANVDNKEAFAKLYENFNRDPEQTPEQTRVPDDEELAEFYYKQKEKIQKIGFPRPTGLRLDEFADFIAQSNH